ncbi:SUN domain-containing ossification factor-like isoform X2 [Biomphalaria glabrata]|uniref:SUN domain-containing ossification factor-like isoform X2 n=1 Tax=Biomphalaria glabrata TaxID=6526 RepID=A0A9W3B9Z2_BIOGL|nr:SUN domain-containing ossification factor-like isoform X2 [Biomphalaria glabrata]
MARRHHEVTTLLVSALVKGMSDRTKVRGLMLVLACCVLLTLQVRDRHGSAFYSGGAFGQLQTEAASKVLKTQDLGAHHGESKVEITESTSGHHVSVVESIVDEASTVQSQVMPTTAESTDSMSSLVDTPVLDEYLHARVLDSAPISPQQPSIYVDTLAYDHLQATESLKSIMPGTWDGMSKYSAGIGGSVLDEENTGGKDEDFPTFDKWSVQYLAEQEKQKSEKDKENTVVVNTAAVTQKKLRHNFAAASCGAKVIASNPEAENINHLLNGNLDEYMLNPCKAKKWFVVELCEPLQVHRVELGTVELFASQPKSFRVFASSRYPTKEWTALGKFDMSPARVVQSFATLLSEEFVKYVKVEMLEHHGGEHYCPLTAFKVLGIDMATDDYENEPEAVEPEGQESAGDLEEDSIEESVNLFTSAKETVVKLVQKVWYKGDQEGNAEKGDNKTLEDAAAVNGSAVPVEEKKGETVPCAQKESSQGPDVPLPPVGIIEPVSSTVDAEEVPIVTKLTDDEQMPMDTKEVPVVIKLGPESDADLPRSRCDNNMWSSYVNLMMLRSQSTPPCTLIAQSGLNTLERNDDKVLIDKPEDADESQHHASVNTVIKSFVDAQGDTVIGDKQEVKMSDTAIQLETSELLEPLDKNATSSFSSDVNPVLESSLPVEKEMSSALPDPHRGQQELQDKEPTLVDSSQSSLFTSADVSVTKSEHLEPSSVSSYQELENDAVSSITPGLHIQKSQVVEQGASDLAESIFLKVSPSPTLNAEDSQEGPAQGFEMPTAIEKPEDKVTEAPEQKESAQGIPSSSVEVNASEEGIASNTLLDHSRAQEEELANASQVSKSIKTIDLVKVGIPSLGKRDNSIMKLNNRIIALEQNVSMTKKYLEELSRVFKQQNEEMMKLLNKTEKRLNVFVAQSEDKSVRQQDYIDVLEQKVVNLTQTIEELQLRVEMLDKKVGDGQCLMIFFQVGLILWMLVFTIRGRSKQSLAYSDHQFLLDTMPKQPTMESSVRQRRNSDTGPGLAIDSSKSMTALKRQKSDTNLANTGKIEDVGDLHKTFQSAAPPITKKKKKKKCKPLVDEQTVSANTQAIVKPLQPSSFSSSAGVLFGTNEGTPVDSSFDLRSHRRKVLASDQCDGLEEDSQQSLDIKELGLTFRTDTGNKQHFARSCKVESQHVYPDYSHDDLSCTHDVQSKSRAFLQRKSFSGGVGVEEDKFQSQDFMQPLYHKNKMSKLSDSGCDNCGQRAKPHLKTLKGKHSSLDETRRASDFVNPNIGQEFFLAENYLHENRFRFLSSPNKDAIDRHTSCPSCSERREAFCPGCIDNSPHHAGCPKGREPQRMTLYSHYPVSMDIQPIPAVILCPSTLTHNVLSSAVSGHSRQSSLSSTVSSASSVVSSPHSKDTGSLPSDHDPELHLPPPSTLPALSTLSMKETHKNKSVEHHSNKSSTSDHTAGQHPIQGTNHVANGTEKKIPTVQQSHKSKSPLGNLPHGASKSMEKDPHQKQENPKVLFKSSSSSLPQGTKPSMPSQTKKSSISKLTNPFRKS